MKTSLLFSVIIAAFLLFDCKKEDSPGANEVFIQDLAFNPSTLNVTAGTTVTWTNKESVTHTATSNSVLFDSGDLTEGKTFTFTFPTAGTYSYHCNHHAEMHGNIVVK